MNAAGLFPYLFCFFLAASFQSRRHANAHIKNIFNSWQDRWPLPWHDGKAAEALSFKRLSVTNFASGWIPLIYVGKESQSAAVSPEMPRRVNCILPLVTVSKTHTHTRPPYRSALLLSYGREGWRNHFSPLSSFIATAEFTGATSEQAKPSW